MKFMMLAFHFCLVSILIILNLQNKCEAQMGKGPSRILDSATLNQKVVGLLLKANGKRYYMSSELCPGGVFLTRPVNENCLCYNGIFQTVRECCTPRHTRIHSDAIEWRSDFKCGTSPLVGNSSSIRRPIRAILPIAKPHNRFGSMIITRSLVGNNTAKWRKFDTEDIIVGNNAIVNMNGKTQFEIVNVKPLGREIKILFGRSANVAVCYSGWLTDEVHQNLRVKMGSPGAATPGCCFSLTPSNIKGEITTNCSTGSIFAELIDVQSADVDIGQCNQDIPEEAPHTIKKRTLATYKTVHLTRGLNQIIRKTPLNYVESQNIEDFIGDRGPILFKRAAVPTEGPAINPKPMNDAPVPTNPTDSTTKSLTNPTTKSPTNPTNLEDPSKTFTSEGVILPRSKDIMKGSFADQSQAINEFIAILRNDINVEIRKPQTPRFQLLKKSFDIFLKLIPNNVVPNMLVKTAFDIFYFLFEELEPILTDPPEMHIKAMHFLTQCLKHEKSLNFSTTGCPEQIDQLIIDPALKAKLESFYVDQPEELERVLESLRHVQIRKDRRFIVELNDIYVEINWKVADFVHSFCFDYFGDEFNAHTYYETELEKLFLADDVQRRWHSSAKNLRYVKGIFPVADLKLSMQQLDKVTATAHHLSRYNGSYWLERPKSGIKLPSNNEKPNPQSALGGPAENSEDRLIFVKNLFDDERVQASEEKKQAGDVSGRSGAASVSSVERTLKYPFQYPDKLPPGELIWDGMAVCLDASYSNSRSYFFDSNMWGVTPSLFELGQLYP